MLNALTSYCYLWMETSMSQWYGEAFRETVYLIFMEGVWSTDSANSEYTYKYVATRHHTHTVAYIRLPTDHTHLTPITVYSQTQVKRTGL